MNVVIKQKLFENYNICILQWTDPEAPEYGSDKPIPDGQTRESIRPDIYIYTTLRINRFKMIQAE